MAERTAAGCIMRMRVVNERAARFRNGSLYRYSRCEKSARVWKRSLILVHAHHKGRRSGAPAGTAGHMSARLDTRGRRSIALVTPQSPANAGLRLQAVRQI